MAESNNAAQYIEACLAILGGMGMERLCDEKTRGILRLVVAGKEYQEIADTQGMSLPTVKSRCRNLWEGLSEYFKVKVSRHNVFGMLDEYLAGNAEIKYEMTNAAEWPLEIVGKPPKFVGRARELVDLNKLAITPGIGIVLGQTEIGKTALVAHYIHSRPNLPKVVWQTIEHGSSIKAIATAMKIDVDGDEETQYINAIVERLQKNEYLLVLDQAERLLGGEEGNRLSLSAYAKEYAAYEGLIKLLTKRNIQSAVILLSQVPFRDLERARNNGLPISILQLGGLTPEDTKKLMHLYGVSNNGSEQLCELYSGHPGLIREALNQINSLYGGDVEDFLKATMYVSESIRVTYQRNLSSLDPMQLDILGLLKKPLSFSQLITAANQASINISRGKLIELIEMLEKMQLVESHTEAGSSLKRFVVNGIVVQCLNRS